MDYKRRRVLLREIVRHGGVSSQDEIASALAKAGVEVTQTTVSRDLAAIGAVRGRDGYRLGDSLVGQSGDSKADQDRFESLVVEHVLSIAKAQSLVVVKTAPGHAQMMASAFDACPPDGVVGTVAGDDTIFLATTSAKASERIVNRLRSVLRGETA